MCHACSYNIKDLFAYTERKITKKLNVIALNNSPNAFDSHLLLNEIDNYLPFRLF